MKTVFFRVLEPPPDEKDDALRTAIRLGPDGSIACRFDVDSTRFARIPQSTFAYWAAESLLQAFTHNDWQRLPERTAKNGLGTLDDFRFVRLSWEVSQRSHKSRTHWFPFSKGGKRSPFYQDTPTVVNWSADGAEVKAYIVHVYQGGHWSRNARSVDFYLRPGLTWPLRGIRFSAQAVPEGGIFSVGGKLLFAAREQLRFLLAVFNSAAFDACVRLFAGKVGGAQYESGLLDRIPVPHAEGETRLALEEDATQGWRVQRRLDSRSEISHAFLLPALLQVEANTLMERARAWDQGTTAAQAELHRLIAKIDDHVYRLYGISDEDRQRIEQGFGTGREAEESADDADGDESDDDGDLAEVDAAPLVASLLSWSVGAAFGRFDVRLATGERRAPPEPEPFDPLPVCSPGMLTGDDGLPVNEPPSGYPLTFPTDGILVDDPGHPRDVVRAVRSVFDAVFDDANARWHEAAELLGAPDLRSWFARDFFEPHIKRYSKSRRKAPIYWQLATASGSYSVWVYIHRATGDTLFRVLNDFVGPKLDHEKAKLDGLTQEAGANPSAAQRREIAQQETFVGELQALKTEVARVAPLWKPNLDDGVILNFAPLWRLVPQSRSWQGECKKAWDKLQSGDYDWAHLAMHLWPERVVPKCSDDRSLAIAHGLDDVFWNEGFGWWSQRVRSPTAYAEADFQTWEKSVAFAGTHLRGLAAEKPDSTVAGWWKRIQAGDGSPILVAALFPQVAKERVRVDDSFRRSLAERLKRWLSGQGTASARENQTLMLRILSIEALQEAYSSHGTDHALNEVRVLTQALQTHQLRTIFARFADEAGPNLRCGEAAYGLDRGELDDTWLGCRSHTDVVAIAQSDHVFASTAGLACHLWSTHPTSGLVYPRLPPTEEVQRQIAWRESGAIRAALSDLLSAATPSAAFGRRARGKVASAPEPRTKPAPAATRTEPATRTVDEVTLRAVKAAVASAADGASKADVLAATGLSDGDWNRAIAALLDRGDVTRTGQKRGTRYHSQGGCNA